MKKYEFTGKTQEYGGKTLRQIRALKDFGDVSKGDIGGWIEDERNLSHEGSCWVNKNAMVYEYARVEDNAKIDDFAKVFGHATIGESCTVSDNAKVCGGVILLGDMAVCANARLSGVFIFNGFFM